MGAVATISVARYWAAGFAGGGDVGFSALEGLARTVGAPLLLVMWPWLFTTAVTFVVTVLLFVGMPMTIVLWPVAPWITHVAMRAFAVGLIAPSLGRCAVRPPPRWA